MCMCAAVSTHLCMYAQIVKIPISQSFFGKILQIILNYITKFSKYNSPSNVFDKRCQFKDIIERTVHVSSSKISMKEQYILGTSISNMMDTCRGISTEILSFLCFSIFCVCLWQNYILKFLWG